MHALPALGRTLIADDFLRGVGEDYVAHTTPEPVPVRLDKVVRGVGHPAMTREPFTLLFSTAWDVFLVEGTYRLRGPSLDAEIHLVPTQTRGQTARRHYHAVFN